MTISIRRTSRAADSPGRYFDRVSLDPYYMHRHRTGRSTSTWVPAGPLLQQRRGAIISAPSNFPSSRLAGIPFSYSNGRLPAPGNHSRLAGPPVNFFVITSASRSDRDLSLFSFSFAPYPVLRSLRLSLTGWYRDHSLFTCLVLFPFPLGWLRAISHRSSSHIHREPIIHCPLPRHSST